MVALPPEATNRPPPRPKGRGLADLARVEYQSSQDAIQQEVAIAPTRANRVDRLGASWRLVRSASQGPPSKQLLHPIRSKRQNSELDLHGGLLSKFSNG
jgi:hypothetical protein